MLRNDKAYAEKATRVSALPGTSRSTWRRSRLRPMWVANCQSYGHRSGVSLQPARSSMVRKLRQAPKELLSKLRFVVKDVSEGHLCCGSAGTYNIFQPELAGRLRERKVANIEKIRPDVIAAGNIGCITQIAAGTAIPVIHTVELIDWATGGSTPPALAGRRVAASADERVAAMSA